MCIPLIVFISFLKQPKEKETTPFSQFPSSSQAASTKKYKVTDENRAKVNSSVLVPKKKVFTLVLLIIYIIFYVHSTNNLYYLFFKQLKEKESNPFSQSPSSSQATSTKKYKITDEDRAKVTSGLLEVFKNEAMGMRKKNETIALPIPFFVLCKEIEATFDYEAIFDWCFQRDVRASHMSLFMRYVSCYILCISLTKFHLYLCY